MTQHTVVIVIYVCQLVYAVWLWRKLRETR